MMRQAAPACQPDPIARPPLPGAGEPTLRRIAQDDVFRFCTSSVNPDLWRTSLPLIVRVLPAPRPLDRLPRGPYLRADAVCAAN